MRKYYFLFVCGLTTSLFGQNLTPPVFSTDSGFYDQAFTLNLSHENANIKIIYTTDGSEPTIENVQGKTYNYKTRYPQFGGELPFELHQDTLQSFIYNSSIVIYDRTNEPNRVANISTSFESNQYFPTEKIDKSFVVRAKAYLDATHFSETITKVFFVNKRYSFPIVSVNVNDDLLFSYENGLWVAGQTFDNWRIDHPLVDDYETTVIANYWASGSASEVPVNFIYLDNGVEKINQTVGVRNHGNGSRYFRNRSYRFYAKSDYGAKEMKHNFFSNYPQDSFKRIIIRNSGNDTYRTMFRDAFIQKLNEHLNFDTQKYQPVVTFVNGEYYGLMNLRERFDEKYFESVYNIKEKDLDFLENEGLADIGDDVQYLKTVAFFKNNNLKNSSKYKEGLTYIDEINFTDYQIAEIFAANFDWPHNNNVYFRKRVNYTPNAPYGHDGRFRWMFKDIDAGFNGIDEWINNSYSHNTLNEAVSSNNFILKGLLTNTAYKNYFLNRFADLMNTTYKEQRVIDLIDVMQENISAEMPRNIKRWNLIKSMDEWNSRVDQLREFARLRPNFQYQHLNDFFNIKGNYRLTTQVNDINKGFVKVNTIEINNSTIGIEGDYKKWTGMYFKNIPITLEAIALPNYEFSHWEGGANSTNQKIVINSKSDLKVKAIFKRKHGAQEINKKEFVLYPNPVVDILNIGSDSPSSIDYKIFSKNGQILEQNSTSNQQINVSNLNNGVYLIQLNQDNERAVKQFIKK